MSVINVRKARAGTDSAGHRWPVDGAVVEVPVEHALALTRIPDGGFSIIERPADDKLTPLEIEVCEVVDDVTENDSAQTAAKSRPQRAPSRRV